MKSRPGCPSLSQEGWVALAQNCLYSLFICPFSFWLRAGFRISCLSVPRQLFALAQSLLQAWGHALGLLGEEAKLG